MSKYNYTDVEQQINDVLVHQSQELSEISVPHMIDIDQKISESEKLLQSLGYKEQQYKVEHKTSRRIMVVPSWQRLCLKAERNIGTNHPLEDLFTQEELSKNETAIKQLNEEYNVLHHLDKYDIAISAVAGLLGAAVDIMLVGIPNRTPKGLKAGTLANYIRDQFDKKFPANEMEKLAQSKATKVPFDAQDNRNTQIWVEDLSSYYHRLLSLGHDPLLGFIFGVADILTGRMTTIDKTGKIAIQVMECYKTRTESKIFLAIAKQIAHLKSDITTSMGLPAPLMGLFNFLQFGKIGEEEQTIAEIVQGMYYEGYDFIHFCSQSIPTMIVEVIIRLGYAFKRIKEGYSIKESIPFSLNREKHPKLATMLFIGHSGATAINAGKVYFTQNPLAINYPQWVAFAKLSYQQAKWLLLEKPDARDSYVRGVIDKELSTTFSSINETFIEYADKYVVVME